MGTVRLIGTVLQKQLEHLIDITFPMKLSNRAEFPHNSHKMWASLLTLSFKNSISFPIGQFQDF